MKYFKFKDPSFREQASTNQSFWEKFWTSCLFFIPKANPDFEKVYDDVLIWFIEYDTENNYTNREVGTNKDGVVICKGPYGKNLGFWTDEDLTLSDYESHFSISYIEQEEFESRWNQSIGEKMCKEDVLTVLKEWNPIDVPDYIKESEYGNYVSGIMNHDHSYKELHHYIISMLNSMGLDNVAVEETERVAMKIWTLIKS